jgi:5'-3' exonuclease
MILCWQLTPKIIRITSSKMFTWHCGLFREYIDMEFRSLADHPDVDYDLERIIDDYYLLLTLLYSRYLPELPDLNSHKFPLGILLETYRITLPQLGGYITDYGRINFDRLELLFRNLASLEDRPNQILWENRSSEAKASKYVNRTVVDNHPLIKFVDTLSFHEKLEQAQSTSGNCIHSDINDSLKDKYKEAQESPTFKDDINRYYYEVFL